MNIYPASLIPPHPQHPRSEEFSTRSDPHIGAALVSQVNWKRGAFMARFDGVTMPTVYLHTLQKRVGVHLYDPHFIGLLAHSCDPNVMLDMDTQEMYALKDIMPGDTLAMDYAATEDYLFRTFDCQCGAPNCRGHVTGRKQKAA